MNREEGGFTVVEVLIAMIILSIGVLALASSAGAITRMMSNARAKTNATSYAQSMLDSVRTRAMATTPGCTNVPAATGSYAPSYGTTLAWQISALSPEERLVRVTVSWRNGRSTSSDQLVTLIYCN